MLTTPKTWSNWFAPLQCVIPVIFVVLNVVPGCGGQLNHTSTGVTERKSSTEINPDSVNSINNSLESSSDGLGQSTNKPESSSIKPPVTRHIIYQTEVGLIVKDYDAFESQFPIVVQQLGGYISKSETSRRYNNEQSGVWVARIPVDRYTEFMQGVEGLGFTESRREDAQDVTEEFVDTEARILNSRKLEQRIVELLDDRTGKLSDVLDIERELARVREEIERSEGQLRVLVDHSSMATITIRCREESHYAPTAAPTFVSRLSNAWLGSLNSLQSALENLLVVSVVLIPWAIAFGLPLLIFCLVIRKRRVRATA